MSSLTKLSPWPYDATVGGVGVMLRPDPQTRMLMTSPKVQPFENVAPQDYNYGAIPPFDEQAYEFRRLIMGFGEKRQQFKIIRRYFYADGVDVSINGMALLGPAFTTITPGSTGEIRGFVEALSGGVLKLFALAGQYVLVRNGDLNSNWTVSKDMGGGVLGQQAVRFKNAGVTPIDALYVANSAHKLWRYDGASDTTVWTDITANLSTDATYQAADYLETIGNSLVRGSSNWVATCEDDPNSTINWNGHVFVGDASLPITWLKTLRDTVFIFKSSGVFTVDGSGLDHELFPALRVTPDVTNGRNAGAFGNSLYFRYGDAFMTLGPNETNLIEMHPVGPERFIENDSPVRGYVTAFEGWSNWFGFIALYNSELNNSYLLKYGSWFVDDQPPLGSSAFVRRTAIYDPISASGSFFEPVMHGAIASFSGKKITALKVSSLPGPNQRLYVGFSDGTIAWCVLPRGTPNPLADSNCRFRTSGSLYYGSHTMNFPANNKSFRGATVFGSTIDSADTVELDYRLSPNAAKRVGDLVPYTVGQLNVFTLSQLGSTEYTALGSFIASGERINLPAGTAGVSIDLRAQLTGPGTTTPVLEGFALHETLRPDLLLERAFVVQARDRQARRDGANDWRTAEQIRTTLQNAAAAAGVVTMVLPDGNTVTVEVNDYNEQLVADQQRFGMAWDIALKAVEFKTLVTFGTVGRMQSYTVGDLKAFIVQQLGVL